MVAPGAKTLHELFDLYVDSNESWLVYAHTAIQPGSSKAIEHLRHEALCANEWPERDWGNTTTPVVFQIPRGYPGAAPYGFYLPSGILFRGQRLNDSADAAALAEEVADHTARGASGRPNLEATISVSDEG